jgi:hypothetical protein
MRRLAVATALGVAASGLATLEAVAVELAALVVPVPVPAWGWFYAPLAPYDPLGYAGFWYSPCYPFPSCGALQYDSLRERRERRFEELRKGPPAAATPPLGIDAWGGSVANRQARANAPLTPDAEVLPQHRGSGSVLPEHAGTGEYLPRFLEGRIRPGAGHQ